MEGELVKRHRLVIPDVGSVSVTRTAEVDDEFRRLYSYVIRDGDGELLERGRDLRSGCSADFGSHPGPREMMGSLLSFLSGAPDSFNSRTAEWARQHDDELFLARLELESEGEDL
jgi:hypothetical protein